MQRRGLFLVYAFGYGLIAAALIFGAWIAFQHAYDSRHVALVRLVYGVVCVICLYGVFLASRLSRRMLEFRRGKSMIEPSKPGKKS